MRDGVYTSPTSLRHQPAHSHSTTASEMALVGSSPFCCFLAQGPFLSVYSHIHWRLMI